MVILRGCKYQKVDLPQTTKHLVATILIDELNPDLNQQFI